MYDNLFDEILAMQDAWGFSPEQSLQFINDNREFYDANMLSEYDSFMAIMTSVYGVNNNVMLH